jgi:hypothetical protein
MIEELSTADLDTFLKKLRLAIANIALPAE